MATFFEDVKTVGSIPPEELDTLIKLLNQSLKLRLKNENVHTPFDDFIREKKMPRDLIDKAVNLLTNIVDIIIRYEKDINDGFENIERGIKNDLDQDKELMASWEKIKLSISQLEFLILTRKRILIKDSFLKIDTFSLICDVRPLFNFKRNEVVDFYFPILLSITDKKGIKSIFELDENDLKRVKQEIDSAYIKLETLKKRISL